MRLGCRITLLGDTPLYQWDVGREVAIEGFEDGDRLGIALSDASEAVAVAIDADGTAPIPDDMLQSGASLVLYLERGDRTVGHTAMRPIRRKQPAGYVATPSQAITYETYKAWVIEQIKAAGELGYITYNDLQEKPSIEGHVLVDDSTLQEIGVRFAEAADVGAVFTVEQEAMGWQ